MVEGTMTGYEEILNSGKLYSVWGSADDGGRYRGYLQEMERFNSLGYSDDAEREKLEILRGLFAEFGGGSYVQAPYHAMWGGHHVHLGSNVYVNFNCTLVDDAQIWVGDGAMFGPNVTIITASHPVSPKLRAEGYGFNKPVHIGRNVWLAAGVTVLPGVSIGDDTVVGACSLVTRDLPAGVIAMGSPARVVRRITADDDIRYDHGKLVSEGMA